MHRHCRVVIPLLVTAVVGCKSEPTAVLPQSALSRPLSTGTIILASSEPRMSPREARLTGALIRRVGPQASVWVEDALKSTLGQRRIEIGDFASQALLDSIYAERSRIQNGRKIAAVGSRSLRLR